MTMDTTKPLVMRVFATVLGHPLNAGHSVTITPEPVDGNSLPGEVDEETAHLLFERGKAVYADDFRPTPVETREAEAQRVVGLEALGGGWWMITAPWLAAPIKEQGEDAAQARYEDVVAEGRPAAAQSVNPTKSDSDTGLDSAAMIPSAEVPQTADGGFVAGVQEG